MAITLDNSGFLGQRNSAPFQESYTMGSGSNGVLFVIAQCDNTDTVTGLTYGGKTCALIMKTGGEPNTRWLYWYMLLSPPSGSNLVVVSGPSFLNVGAASYFGVNQSYTLDNTLAFTASGTNVTSYTTSITTIAKNAWVLGVGTATTSAAAGAGETLRANDTNTETWIMADSNGPVTPAGSYSMTTNGSNSKMGNMMLSFAPATGSSASSTSWMEGHRGFQTKRGVR